MKVPNTPVGDCTHGSDFDAFARDYDDALRAGLSLTGESKDYYARERIELLRRRLEELDFRPQRVLDFGCGTGSSIPYLLAGLGPRLLVGLDVSAASLEIARQCHASPRVIFTQPAGLAPLGDFDLVFCNGVFHHIPVDERLQAVALIHRTLSPGGIFALWENNPWNPGTRLVMRRIAFDRDAVMLTAADARALLAEGGFEWIRTDFRFYFPRQLRWLRPVEHTLTQLPLGGQYQVLARKPPR